MKNALLLMTLMLGLLSLNAQTILSPVMTFKEHPQTHNMHITSDGNYLYTCNGGKSDYGQISKLDLFGTKIAAYKIDLDMRSIMYNAGDKKLYVNTYGKELYRIDDLLMGKYSKVYDFPDVSEQATPALSHNGKLIYFMDYGTVSVYSMKDGSLKNKIYGLNAKDNTMAGGTAIAVDKKNMYSWDADSKRLYVYDLKGKFKKEYVLNDGSYGFSLSYLNGMIFVSDDGNYDIGTWYAYYAK